MGALLVTPEFGGDLLENWQSEFLQFSLYIIATVWLLQRGSNESKTLEDAGLESDEEQKVGEYAQPDSPAWAKAAGIRRWIYSNSLMFLMTAIFFLSWFGQSVNGWRAFNNTQDEHKSAHISYGEYLVNADFWDRSLQNGSPSFWRSARWPSSRSICASAAHRSRSPSARRTTKPPARASPSSGCRLPAATANAPARRFATPGRMPMQTPVRLIPAAAPQLVSDLGQCPLVNGSLSVPARAESASPPPFSGTKG